MDYCQDTGTEWFTQSPNLAASAPHRVFTGGAPAPLTDDAARAQVISELGILFGLPQHLTCSGHVCHGQIWQLSLSFLFPTTSVCSQAKPVGTAAQGWGALLTRLCLWSTGGGIMKITSPWWDELAKTNTGVTWGSGITQLLHWCCKCFCRTVVGNPISRHVPLGLDEPWTRCSVCSMPSYLLGI